MPAATIYALVDSREPGAYRYVGRTVRPLERRLYFHLYRAASDSNLHKARWIARVLESGGEVQAVVLEECDAAVQNDREMAWIAACRMDGHPLTNMTDGGEGGVPSSEVRRRISEALRGRKRPPHVAEAARRNGLRYVGSANPHYGKTHTPEAKERMAAARRGVSLSAAHRQKMSTGMMGRNRGDRNGSAKLNEEQVRAIYAARKDGQTARDVAAEYGIHEMTVYKITQGRSWAHLNLSTEG